MTELANLIKNRQLNWAVYSVQGSLDKNNGAMGGEQKISVARRTRARREDNKKVGKKDKKFRKRDQGRVIIPAEVNMESESEDGA